MLCVLSQSPLGNQRSKKRKLYHKKLILVFFFVFFFSLSHFTFLPWFFPHFSILSTFAVGDTSVRGPELVVPEVVVESTPDV